VYDALSLDTQSPPLLVTASFGRILSGALLDLFPPHRRLNVHPSLLPTYRGPAPIQHALIDGVAETGVCVIGMTKFKRSAGGVDLGDVWGRVPMVCDIARVVVLSVLIFSYIFLLERARESNFCRFARCTRHSRWPRTRPSFEAGACWRGMCISMYMINKHSARSL
jgi:hypothetical protein